MKKSGAKFIASLALKTSSKRPASFNSIYSQASKRQHIPSMEPSDGVDSQVNTLTMRSQALKKQHLPSKGPSNGVDAAINTLPLMSQASKVQHLPSKGPSNGVDAQVNTLPVMSQASKKQHLPSKGASNGVDAQENTLPVMSQASKKQHLPSKRPSNGVIAQVNRRMRSQTSKKQYLPSKGPSNVDKPHGPANDDLENIEEKVIEQEVENEGDNVENIDDLIELEIPNEEENAKRKGRGMNKCAELAKLRPGEKLPIKFINRCAVGPNQAVWVRNIGVIFRDPSLVPVQLKKWRDLTEITREHLWACVKEHFSCDDMDENKNDVLNHMRSLWNKWRSKLKFDHLKDCEHKEDGLKKIPPPMMKKEDWEWCVKDLFFSEQYQKKSKTNKENRASKLVCHTLGSRSSEQIKNQLVIS